MPMQFNPNRIQAVPIGSNQSAIANLTGQLRGAVGNLTGAVSGAGQDIRSDKVTQLIGSGALKGMSEAEARSAIAQAGQGDVNKQTMSNIENILGGKGSAEKAKVLADAKLASENEANMLAKLGIASREGIASKDRSSRAGIAKMQTDARTSNRTLNELANIQSQKVAQENKVKNLKLQALLSGKDDKFGDIVTTGVGKEFVANPEFVTERTGKVAELFDDDNLFWDAEFGDDTSKSIVDELIFQATDTAEGRKAIASKSKEAIFSYIDSQLAKRGQKIDEGIFGDLSIVNK